MLLKKDFGSSTRYVSYYDVDEDRFIEIDHSSSNQINKVSLWNKRNEYPEAFEACGLVYLENVCHGELNEELDTNLLMIAENCFQEVC